MASLPRCGHTKAGACPGCFPDLAEPEQRQEIAEWREELADAQRKAAGQLYCTEHERHDECWEFRRPGPEPEPLTCHEAFEQLKRRYVGP